VVVRGRDKCSPNGPQPQRSVSILLSKQEHVPELKQDFNVAHQNNWPFQPMQLCTSLDIDERPLDMSTPL
jgi:hypothetical protein